MLYLSPEEVSLLLTELSMAWPGLAWPYIRATFCWQPEIIDAIVILSDQSTFIGRGRSESWLLCVLFCWQGRHS